MRLLLRYGLITRVIKNLAVHYRVGKKTGFFDFAMSTNKLKKKKRNKNSFNIRYVFCLRISIKDSYEKVFMNYFICLFILLIFLIVHRKGFNKKTNFCLVFCTKIYRQLILVYFNLSLENM